MADDCLTMTDVMVARTEQDPVLENDQAQPETTHALDISDQQLSVGMAVVTEEVEWAEQNLESEDAVKHETEQLLDVDDGIFRACVEERYYKPFTRRKVTYKDTHTTKQRTQIRSNSLSSYSGSDPSDVLRSYLREIGRYPLLTAEGEVYLSKYIQAGILARVAMGNYDGLTEKQVTFYSSFVQGVIGDAELGQNQKRHINRMAQDGQKARNIMMESNLRLVVSIAKAYKNQTVSMDLKDLIQEGNIGLAVAANKFDWRKGFRFTTYATNWVRQNITRAISNQERTIRLPAHAASEVTRINRAVRAASERRPDHRFSVQEISELTGIPAAKIGEYLPHIGRSRIQPKSFSELVGEEDSSELGDFIADPDSSVEIDTALQEADFKALKARIDILLPNPKERHIFFERLGFAGEVKTLQELGDEYGVSRERIRQIERIAKDRLISRLALDEQYADEIIGRRLKNKDKR